MEIELRLKILKRGEACAKPDAVILIPAAAFMQSELTCGSIWWPCPRSRTRLLAALYKNASSDNAWIKITPQPPGTFLSLKGRPLYNVLELADACALSAGIFTAAGQKIRKGR